MNESTGNRRANLWLIEVAIISIGLVAVFCLPLPYNFLVPVALVGISYLQAQRFHLRGSLKPQRR
ncbi:MAG: hypothetical protein BWY87_01087 [Deltaproteobacteria bacterium ADurb.Bin510]|nr:MAG: hypothetical protein BWY87_01087 [Deltaproteobacteria bacterium ADurb.Bin510]